MSTVISGKDYFKNIKNMETIPRDLKNCKCCEHHRFNFPTLGSSLPKFNNNNNKNTNKDCKCPCRHIAREICRKWDEIHEVESINSESEISSDSDDTPGSLEDFIVEDEGFNKKERKKLDKIINKFKKRKYT